MYLQWICPPVLSVPPLRSCSQLLPQWCTAQKCGAEGKCLAWSSSHGRALPSVPGPRRAAEGRIRCGWWSCCGGSCCWKQQSPCGKTESRVKAELWGRQKSKNYTCDSACCWGANPSTKGSGKVCATLISSTCQNPAAPELGTKFEQGEHPFFSGGTVTLNTWEGQGRGWHINLNGSLEDSGWQSPLMLQSHLLLPILASNWDAIQSPGHLQVNFLHLPYYLQTDWKRIMSILDQWLGIR